MGKSKVACKQGLVSKKAVVISNLETRLVSEVFRNGAKINKKIEFEGCINEEGSEVVDKGEDPREQHEDQIVEGEEPSKPKRKMKKRKKAEDSGEDVIEENQVLSLAKKLRKGMTGEKNPQEVLLLDVWKKKWRNKARFPYGNRHEYYGYRVGGMEEDPRLQFMQREWFENKDVLDVGCSEGYIPIVLAQKYKVKSMWGVDIDSFLIKRAWQHLEEEANKKNDTKIQEVVNVAPAANPKPDSMQKKMKKRKLKVLESHNHMKGFGEPLERDDEVFYDTTTNFVQDDGTSTCKGDDEEPVDKKCLLDAQDTSKIVAPKRDPLLNTHHPGQEEFQGLVGNELIEQVGFVEANFLEYEIDPEYYVDTVLCLSTTKWVHLNWGDDGLMQLFQKIYDFLRPGGVLILEPQHWKSYRKNRKLTLEVHKVYLTIERRPEEFSKILIDEIGFKSCITVASTIPGSEKGFDRPIYLYTK